MGSRGQKADVLMLHLLGRCNLECAHCYMEGSPRRHERLALDAVLRAIGECCSLGVTNISVTGGEPLLYPELDRVLTAAAAVPDVKGHALHQWDARHPPSRRPICRTRPATERQHRRASRFPRQVPQLARRFRGGRERRSAGCRMRRSGNHYHAAFPMAIWILVPFRWSIGPPVSARTVFSRSLCWILAAASKSPTNA